MARFDRCHGCDHPRDAHDATGCLRPRCECRAFVHLSAPWAIAADAGSARRPRRRVAPTATEDAS